MDDQDLVDVCRQLWHMVKGQTDGRLLVGV